MGAWLSRSYDGLEAEVVADLRAEAREAAAAAGAAAASPPTADVPPCVRRYLETAGVLAGGDHHRYMLVTAQQAGRFKYDDAGPWQTLAATQRASPLVPAFHWSARCSCRPLPLVGMRGFDNRVRGCGRLHWRLGGWLRVYGAEGAVQDRSQLARWLAETPGFPHAMLPSPWLRWEAVPGSDTEARAVVSHLGSTASGVFGFDGEGLLASFRSEDNVRPLAGGGDEARPWVVRYRGHRRVPVAGSTGTSSAAASMFVPTESEAFRVDADGQERPYVRFALEGLSGEMVPGRQ